MAEPVAPPPRSTGPLADVRVIDCSTVIAGPSCAKYLADFGADVIKVERPPDGDSTRRMGVPDPADGVSLSWKLFNRNKRSVVLDLKSAEDRDRLLRLVEGAHVLVENLRPGKLEALGLGPDVLLARNPRLVITRVTGFGQTGPYAHRAGFATLAEAMAGWASISGEPGGPPMLPPIALTDELAGLASAFASMVALHSGVGQVVDVNLVESLLQVMGPIVPAWFQAGFLQGRMGSSLPNSVPRGVWPASDGRWVAISASSDSVARRVMQLVGLGDHPGVATVAGRVEHRVEVEDAVARFVASRPAGDVVAGFEAAEAAAAVVYDLSDLAADPHLAARGAFVEVDGVTMQGLVANLSATPGAVRWVGRPYGADTDAVLDELS
ncbi:MAG: CoA transferase [Acidimicrobiia bacterium]|nr:CoA transferase [Acidimicrobiia bacterium]